MAETRELRVRVDSELDEELTELAKTTGRDKLTLAREALVERLDVDG